MNTSQFKKWKNKEIEKTENLLSKSKYKGKLIKLYPEFNLESPYTTSLDPYVPLWLMLPFFKKIIVGILPYLKTPKNFIDWYGVTPEQMLWLYEIEKIELRILFPTSLYSIPKYLNKFFEIGLPSGYRDFKFCQYLLGKDKFDYLKDRFRNCIGDYTRDISIDSYKGNYQRALKTAETVYLQLHSYYYERQAWEFEELFLRDKSQAFTWIEMCRLFLIGQVNYSFGGVHSIARNAIDKSFEKYNEKVIFPSDLGKILIEVFKLIPNKSDELWSFDLNDLVRFNFYSNNELTHKVLYSLKEEVNKGKVKIDSIEDLKTLILKSRKEDKFFCKTFNILAGAGISFAASSINLLGLLSGIGYSIVSEFYPKMNKKIAIPLKNSIQKIFDKPNLTLLIKLDDEIKNKFKNA
ncbi:MAG: hypothetical protein KAW92_01420 [Candidatus Cloacimonetes bacterium]|nr:hypothetical protein [Candidatus Cloacimonadota bacterium]